MSCFQYLVCARFFFVLPLLLRVAEVNFGLSPVTGDQVSQLCRLRFCHYTPQHLPFLTTRTGIIKDRYIDR